MNIRKKKAGMNQKHEKGHTFVELMISMGIISVLFSGLLHQYTASIAAAHDHSIRVATQVQAQAILQTITSELRILGNGVPFDQANFQIGEDTLNDPSVTEPLDVSTAAADYIAFRLNESGDVYLLTQDYDPATSFELFLTDVSNLQENDPIYISNSVVAGDDGLYATADVPKNELLLRNTESFVPAILTIV